MSQEVYILGGKCPGGKCPGGKCPWGKCPGGKCPRGICLEGLCPRTYTETMALTSYINIYTICKEFSNWLDINSLGNPSTSN